MLQADGRSGQKVLKGIERPSVLTARFAPSRRSPSRYHEAVSGNAPSRPSARRRANASADLRQFVALVMESRGNLAGLTTSSSSRWSEPSSRFRDFWAVRYLLCEQREAVDQRHTGSAYGRGPAVEKGEGCARCG